jgi:cytochrome P450
VLRDTGAAVWLECHQVWCLSRYRDVHGALRDHRTFSSAQGVALTGEVNRMLIGNSVASDPPDHDHIRAITGPQLSHRNLQTYAQEFRDRAELLVEELVSAGSFDAVADFAQNFPLSLVPDLLGWPADARAHLLDWSSALLNAIGPMNQRTIAGLPALQEMGVFTHEIATTGRLAEGSWGALMLGKARTAGIADNLVPGLIIDYLAPSLDTTISALSSMLWLLGSRPDQWALLCAHPELIPNAFNEVLRYEAPIRGFSRIVTRDVNLGGATIPGRSRVLVLYASANRDERFWEAPDTFDITRRNAAAHVGFGHGVHACLGMGLARLEANALLTALSNRVEQLEVGEPTWRLNNTSRGLESLKVKVTQRPRQ